MADPRYRRARAGLPVSPGARRRQTILPNGPGGTVPSLPIVFTVGANAITDTSANVIGSINPNNAVGDVSWWFAYGTTPPFAGMGSTTTPVVISTGTTPVTVNLTLPGLTTGTTYYFVLVGQCAAGTVYGNTVSFEAAVVQLKPLPTAFSQAFVTIPHFQVPVSIGQSGMGVVEQDTLEEITANVTTIALCPVGACSQIPSFGRPDVLFAQEPIATDDLVAAIQAQEPRATEDVLSQLMPDGQTWGITLTTSYTGAQGV